MSSFQTRQAKLLAEAEKFLGKAVSQYAGSETEARFQILESVASLHGGFGLEAYHSSFSVIPITRSSGLLRDGRALLDILFRSSIHPSIALSALAREQLSQTARRKTGAYHTDFRLASRMAAAAVEKLRPRSRVVDPACGAGILLCALSVAYGGRDQRKMSRWLAESVYAADLSGPALRGALLALSSLTNDLSVITLMRSKWLEGDSLLLPAEKWAQLAPTGFEVVIGNPPWEKLRLTRHEFAQSAGDETHYGGPTTVDRTALAKDKAQVEGYVETLRNSYSSLRDGDADLYIAFLELFYRLCAPRGQIVALAPAGLIRSQGTQAIRETLFASSERLSLSIVENRAAFFQIDTRFKFLLIQATKAAGRAIRSPLNIQYEAGHDGGVETLSSVKLARSDLKSIRPDLTVPEVRNNREWRLFKKLSSLGVRWNDVRWGWKPDICREVDMTQDRPSFNRHRFGENWLPVIEGRMVQPHRFGAKGFVSGSGRRAVWARFPLGAEKIQPQFWINPTDLTGQASVRANTWRGGFCDITGQTNERSMMAAMIPPGVVCGNKVPTVIFPNDRSAERLMVWTAIMNSIVFDWMLRRIITTTVNYFLLLSVPMPKIMDGGLPWKRIVERMQGLRTLGNSRSQPPYRRAALLRAEIDAEVACAYGLTVSEFGLLLEDFPLFDRGQRPLPGEGVSTITKDLSRAVFAERTGKPSQPWRDRADMAEKAGASAYVPSEFASGEALHHTIVAVNDE